MTDTRRDYAGMLRTLQRRYDCTQAYLGEQIIGVNQRTLRSWLAGERPSATARKLIELLWRLGPSSR